ncbi:D-alanine--D-alanine ligase [Salinicoccus halodurans]|uniref:D-alanine--D-alanine ligase n=1 Tax=Salinicoccus halodurans TaxID=407035 RepID=A0A0F7HL91_9STAP|nr:D-alanine--D-alanine ligase [Salinicoccus halodurans]AKG74696.1 D-alanine--D-alanine ligase [Salinicoccus halodurans]SFK88359.1 D-alanine--D-alanine ligase [Salinicoccus halodurans]
MAKLNVGILYGGQSTEHEVSMRSAESVLEALDKDKYNVKLVHISKRGEWLLSHQSDEIKSLERGSGATGLSVTPPKQLSSAEGGEAFDVILPILHGTAGEDGSVQGLLEMADIPYVGCNVRSSAVCMDKDMTKKLLKFEGIKVADWILFRHDEKESVNYETVREKLGLPMFVKPVNQGSSVGVSKVTDEKSFYEAVELAFQFDTKVMVESAVEGREIEVSVLGNTNPVASVPGEIVSNTEFYSYESKYIDESGAALEIPAKLDEETEENIRRTALDAFRILDCEGMARVDVFLTENGEVIVNEINTLPGFTSISMYPKLLEASGIEYPELLDRLIELSLERHNRNRQLKTDIM